MKRNGHPCPPWLWPNLLGLDAPVVAVAWQWLFTRVFGADLPAVFHLILGLSVWCIYLADRLYDSIRAPSIGSQTDRLSFTQLHFSTLVCVALTATVANLFLIIRYVPRSLILTGLITAGLLGVYYLIRLKRNARLASAIPREILCGMIFGLGCVIAPHAFLANNGGWDYFFATILLGLVCSANCILISVWEKEEDIACNARSIASSPSRLIPHLAHALTGLIILAATMAFFGLWQIHIAVCLSAFSLRMMLHFENHLSQRTLRVLADAVLLSPLLLAFL
jgi:uncharacterized membrane protein YiaA